MRNILFSAVLALSFMSLSCSHMSNSACCSKKQSCAEGECKMEKKGKEACKAGECKDKSCKSTSKKSSDCSECKCSDKA